MDSDSENPGASSEVAMNTQKNKVLAMFAAEAFNTAKDEDKKGEDSFDDQSQLIDKDDQIYGDDINELKPEHAAKPRKSVMGLQIDPHRERRKSSVFSIASGKSDKDVKTRYQVLNELQNGDYFGEIAIISKLPRTASVHTIKNTVCGSILKEHLLSFLENFHDSRAQIMTKVNSYNDLLF